MITLQGICLTYPTGRKALSDISLTLQSGAKTALLGANGAGKSTLLAVLAGLIRPDTGNIAGLTGRTGFIFQNADDQLFMPTVVDDIRFGLINAGLNAEEIETEMTAVLKQFRISHLKDVPCRELSGGEKKRAALAGVLALHPDILLLDEPTSQLDPRGKREFAEILNSLPQTCIIATHDLFLAQKICQNAVILDQGAIAAAGAVNTIINNDELLLRCGLK